jgi:hypothetical protein
MLSLEASDFVAPIVIPSLCATGTGGMTLTFLELFLVPRLPAVLRVVFFAAFFVVFFAALRVPAFFVDFLAAFFVDFFAPLYAEDLAALLFFVPFLPPLRAPLDFLVPFLAAISLAPFIGLSLASP